MSARQRHVGVAITSRLKIEKKDGNEMNTHMNPSFFNQYAVREKNQRSMEARSHLESLLVVCCSRWRTT